jgi:hypothetical protein
MSIHDLAAERAKRLTRRTSTKSSAPGFCKVYDIETARSAQSVRIPDQVWEEMEAANELYEQLLEEGRQVRFAEMRGRIVAALCDLDGNVVRPLSLTEAIEVYDEPDSAA